MSCLRLHILVCLTIVLFTMTLADRKNARKVCKTRLTKLGNKISTIIVEGDKLADIPDLVIQFKAAFADFSKEHEEVVKLDEDNDMQNDAYYNQVESNFLKVLANAKDVKTPVPKVQSSNLSASNTTVVGLLSLPKLELEVFTGEPIKYHTFVKAFKASVEKCTDDTDVSLQGVGTRDSVMNEIHCANTYIVFLLTCMTVFLWPCL